MNTHVFVVDEKTFKIHLEYMFAGTGAKDKQSIFLSKSDTNNFKWQTENGLVFMISDISRIRKGDNIIFYLQSYKNNSGTFFGIFKAETEAFFDENDDNNYLKTELGKGLSFRIKISPKYVYSVGITEHEYLDDLTGKEFPYQLCWSMIYRKLKGNRGCTMITQYEFDDLKSKLENKNNSQILNGTSFSFDSREGKIISKDDVFLYTGRENSLEIKPRLLYKANRANAFESHLQALVMQKFDDKILKDKLLSLDNGNIWIGNEVSCGVGMQRIDIMIIEENETEIHLKIVELKDEEPYDYILEEQLPWYLKWTSQYVVPNLLKYRKPIIIHPCIIAKSIEKTNNEDIVNKIRTTKLISLNIPNVNISPTEYIGFNISKTDITFEKIV